MMERKKSVLDVGYMEKLSPVFRGKVGNRIAKIVLHLLAIDRVNNVYAKYFDRSGAWFSDGLLDSLGVNYRLGNAERLKHLPEGAFITVSNHPYGGLDGIMLIHLMAGIRPDYKVMVNQILTLIETMDENFISVQPKKGNKSGAQGTGVNGIRETLKRLKDGHPVGFFPAGAVSMFHFRNFRIKDREWQEGIIKLIQLAGVPVVPIRFRDRNSIFFYILGIVSWKIRTLRMPYEVFNKKGQRPRIVIGEVIPAGKIASFSNTKALGAYLKEAVYSTPVPKDFIFKTALKPTPKHLKK
jgi:putative hemolysin